MFVRRLTPQEDKLDWTRLGAADLDPVARHLGALLGAAHRRGATRRPKQPWTEEDRRRLLARAIALAGMHEAMYVAYCDLVRR
jgi:predicted amidophosphoribosyltransferase